MTKIDKQLQLKPNNKSDWSVKRNRSGAIKRDGKLDSSTEKGKVPPGPITGKSKK